MRVERRAQKPDAQAFDEVRIVTVPRYKTSGLSGDEWRIHAAIRFYRKGNLVYEVGARNTEKACAMVGYHYLNAVDEGKAYFAGEGDVCDQEGCAEKATITYRLKREYSRDNPHEWNKEYSKEDAPIRKFCERHSTRGDCAYEDADANYEIVSGEPNEPSGVDVKPSGFGG